MAEKTKTKEEKHSFQAEVSKLLHIVANSLYKEKDVFLRELVSNSSDACDKLRYAAVTAPELIANQPQFQIDVIPNQKSKTLSISDNGIGMSKEELVENLGTIARSGTSAFIEQAATDDDSDPISLIGQFGVGFYAAFMVADKVVVTSLKAGNDSAWQWESEGSGDFTIAPAKRPTRGTTVTLHLKKGAKDFLEPTTLRRVVKRYSDHVGLPIVLKGNKDETLNSAAALWTRSKSDIDDEQYKEFYHHVGQSFDDPWLTLHTRAEGRIEYTLLLFVPSTKPFDLFDPARQHQVKLYVKRVFVTDDMPGLVPPYLRFLRGVVDSEDLNLNISREVLQSSPLVSKIRKDIVKRVFRELERKSKKRTEDFLLFWNNFGPVIKEGLYEDPDIRDSIFKIALFRTTHSDELTTLAEYIGRMSDSQKEIFFITGDNAETLPKSPQLEGFLAREVEVLLLSDSIDDFWTSAVAEFENKKFRSVTHGATDLSDIKIENSKSESKTDKEKSSDDGLDSLLALLKLTLNNHVKDVRVSERLTESPVCLVADESSMDMHIEKLLQQQGRLDTVSPRILEVNPSHNLIRTLHKISKEKNAGDFLEDAAFLLLDQAYILEGESPIDAQAFGKRLADTMTRVFASNPEKDTDG